MNHNTPGHALARFTVPWTRLDWPLDGDALFPAARPLVLEIGFGNGAFLYELARRHPERNHLGIERAWGSVQRLLGRLARGPLPNLKVLEGDAAWMLARLFRPEALDEVFVQFSDPWPKARHHGRRLIQPAFVARLAERLAVGGTLTVVTDHAAYADWIGGVLAAQRALEPSLGAPVVHALPARTPTKYERKALERGRRIHYFVWHKARPTPGATARADEVGAMPNVLLRGPLALPEVLAALAPERWRESQGELEAVIKLEGVYRAQGAEAGLVELLVVEGGFSQHLAVLVSAQAGGTVLLKPAAIGHPRPTWGVKRAVWLLGRVLLERCPQLQPVSSTVGPLPPPPAP